MPGSPLIHIGYPKTGTTWLQLGLFASHRFGFCPVGGAPKTFGAHFVYGEIDGLRNPFDFAPDVLRREYDSMSGGSAGYPVISNEALLCHPFSGGVQAREIGLKIRDVFPEAKILITIREQQSIIVSLYEHYLRMGGVASLERFIGDKSHQSLFPLFDKGYLEYDKCVRFYRDLFGAESVLVLPFEWIKLDPRKFLTSIYGFVRADMPEDDRLRQLVIQEPKNVSAPQYACAQHYLRLMNLLGKPSSSNGYSAVGYKRLATTFFSIAASLTPKRAALAYRGGIKKKVERLIGATYADSNSRTSELTGLDLVSLGYRA